MRPQEHEHPLRRPTVLLLHGFGDDHSTFDDLVVRLTKNGIPAIAPDLPGFDASPLTPRSPREMAREIGAAVKGDGSSETPYHVVGHSLGGMVAFFLAELGCITIRSLILIEGTVSTKDFEFFSSLEKSPHGDAGFVEFRQYIWTRRTISPAYRRYADVLQEASPTFFKAVVRGALDDFPAARTLIQQLFLPVAYCYGDRSRSGRAGDALAKDVGWQTFFFPGATHWVHEDAPVEFFEFLMNWLDRYEGAQKI